MFQCLVALTTDSNIARANPPQGVDILVPGNPVKPAPERTPRIELLRPQIKLHQHLLHHVIGKVQIPAMSTLHQKSLQPLSGSGDEVLERLLVDLGEPLAIR